MPQRCPILLCLTLENNRGRSPELCFWLKENAHGAKFAMHGRPECRIYSNASDLKSAGILFQMIFYFLKAAMSSIFVQI